MDLRFAVLGPVRAWRGEVPLEIGSPQRQAVLVALLLREGRPATAQELLDAVWGEGTPVTAVGRLRTVVSALRQVLEPGRPARSPSRVLLSVNGGYALPVPSSALDLRLVESCVNEAETTRASGDVSGAVALLDNALALWTGEPLTGVPGPYAASQQSRLAERKLALLETRIDLCLELGRHTEVVSELMPLTTDNPLRERFRGQLMTALYRSGRQAEALEVYAATRRLLIQELGIEPGPDLAAIQQQILTRPTPAPPHSEAGDPAPVPAPRPWQLPPDIHDFTGRAEAVKRLADHLVADATMPIAAVCGMGGVGKTTLAVHVAHLVRARFQDGQLYADLNGADDRAVAPGDALGHFLRALGFKDGGIPPEEQERAALFRTAMAGRRMLVLLDNARDAGQVRSLLPGTAGSAVLVTSRATLAGLPGAGPVMLEPMTLEEARELFVKAVGGVGEAPQGNRAVADPEATDAVLAACGRLPLAVRIVAARLATRPNWKVASIAERLSDERRRLTELKAGSLAVEATFRLGYGLLSPAQSRAFRLPATADVPGLPVAAIAAALELDEAETEDLCESLVDAGLFLCGTEPGRYRYHDLLRLFARDQPDQERAAVIPRLLDFYLASAKNLLPLRTPGSLLPAYLEATRCAGVVFPDEASVQYWLDVERPNLQGIYRQAAAASPEARRLAADLAWLMAESLDLTDRTPEIADALRAVALAAAIAAEHRTEARVRMALGCLLGFTDRRAATEELHAALILHGRLNDPRALAWTHYALGVCAHLSGEYGEALTRYQSAVALIRELGDPWGEGRVLGSLAITQAWSGDHAGVASSTGRALDLARDLGNHAMGSHAHQALGISQILQRRFEAALESFSESVRLAVEGHWRAQSGWAIGLRAVTLLALGRIVEASVAAEDAVRVLTEAGDAHHLPDAIALRDLTAALPSGPPPTAASRELATGLRALGILSDDGCAC